MNIRISELLEAKDKHRDASDKLRDEKDLMRAEKDLEISQLRAEKDREISDLRAQTGMELADLRAKNENQRDASDRLRDESDRLRDEKDKQINRLVHEKEEIIDQMQAMQMANVKRGAATGTITGKPLSFSPLTLLYIDVCFSHRYHYRAMEPSLK